jgi:hypothetical protein
MLKLLLCLQLFQVAFLLLHDWLPLGSLSNLPAVRAENPHRNLFLTTILSALPFALALVFSILHQAHGYPHWLFLYLCIAYGLLFYGELNAWWFPYAFGAGPEKVARFQHMFSRTNAFLPERNGIRINTLHVILHLSTLATLITLAVLVV